MKTVSITNHLPAATAIACALAGAANAALVNGGFESGLAGWTTADQVGSDGTFFVQSGVLSPVNGFDVPAPPQGINAAMTDSGAGGAHVLYQDFTIPTGVTSATVAFSLFLNNGAGTYFNINSLDWALANPAGGTNLNQQARVDLMTITGDAFSVAAGNVLQNLFQTTAQTPAVTGYNAFSVDVTAVFQAHAGETIRLRFAETDNVNFFNLGVDNVSVTAVPAPAACSVLLGLLAGSRRRSRR
ncbi:MAG: hypothetical protein JSR77_14330 [Planctomycetes bacterium]|nr:hypothetical protein [Planctomycetota bacterium]